MAPDSRRRLMQIGFAALLARKKQVHKQYLFEKRGKDGFVFEPVLRQNNAALEDEEYMRKRFYSSVVLKAAERGELETSIPADEGIEVQAARRLWAGRAGTGWGNSNRGGYMKSLDPGIKGGGFRGMEGSQLGSVVAEVDALMQAYMRYQDKSLLPLKAMANRATQDLFRRIARDKRAGAVKGGGTIASTGKYKDYIAPPQGGAVKTPNQMLWYLLPHLGDIPAGATKEQRTEWMRNAIAQYEKSHLNQPPFLKSTAVTNRKRVEGDMANFIAKYYPDMGNYDRLTQAVFDDSKDRSPYQGSAQFYKDFPHLDGLNEDEIAFMRDRFARKGMLFPGIVGGTETLGKAGGGALNTESTAIGSPDLLTTVFNKNSIEDIFPKSFRNYINQKDPDQKSMTPKQFAAQEIRFNDIEEVKKFMAWMVKTLNDEIRHQAHQSVKGQPVSQRMASHGFGEYGEMYSNLLGSIVMGDHKPVNLPPFADKKAKVGRRSRTGKDVILNQLGGLLKFRVDAVWVTYGETKPGYAPGAYQLKISEMHFEPNVKHTLEVEELDKLKGVEMEKSWDAMRDGFYQDGISASYHGMDMMTMGGQGSRMFMGDLSPVTSTAYFTSTISVGDFAQRLRYLVEIAANEWFSSPDGFQGYFDLRSMEGGAFKEWAMHWEEESITLQQAINKRESARWERWIATPQVGGGKTAAPPSIAKTWEGPLRLGPFVHSTKYLGAAQSVGRRRHGYYVHGDSVLPQ